MIIDKSNLLVATRLLAVLLVCRTATGLLPFLDSRAVLSSSQVSRQSLCLYADVTKKVEDTKSSSESKHRKKNKQQQAQQRNTEQEPCNVVFTHTNADFDSLAAAVALALLWNNDESSKDRPTHVVLPRGVNPIVQRFLAFHKHLLPLRGFKTILPEDVHKIGVVDAQGANRIGRGQAWLDQAQSIHIFDHHDVHAPTTTNQKNNNNNNNNDEETSKSNTTKYSSSLLERATEVVIDQVGSTTTLLVERLKEAGITPKPHEATLFCLGIRADTGGLVYEGTTIRDAAALLWCLEQGASQVAISEFGVNKVTEEQRAVLNDALGSTHTEFINGLRVSSVLVSSTQEQYVAGLAQVCEEVLELTDSDVFVLGATHRSGGGTKKSSSAAAAPASQWISLIGRASARAAGVDLNKVMRKFGGGGHPKAAAASLGCQSPDNNNEEEEKEQEGQTATSLSLQKSIELAKTGNLSPAKALSTAMSMIRDQIPEQLVASNCMVPFKGMVTVSTDHTVAEARHIFDSHNLRSAPVVDENNRYRSSLKLNDLVKASRAGRSKDKLKGMIRPSVKTVLPDTSLADLEDLLVHKGVGRIPVVDDDGLLVGMVTRTDVLRQHKLYDESDLD